MCPKGKGGRSHPAVLRHDTTNEVKHSRQGKAIKMSKRHPGSRHYTALNQRRWQLLRLRVFGRDDWRCVKCGKAGRLECDHVVPLHRGGDPYNPANLQSLCKHCHIEKTRADTGKVPDLAREAWRELVAEIYNA